MRLYENVINIIKPIGKKNCEKIRIDSNIDSNKKCARFWILNMLIDNCEKCL